MSDKAGQQLGNYRLIRLIGEGGFAQVYLGEHVYLDTQAAIKILHAQLTSDNVEWFRTEARTIARLVHPNIVRVLDYGVDAMTPFLVLDYAPNGSLRQQHPKGMRVPLPTIVSYVKQVAEALQYAHDEKLIHRDVKPENMLLGRRREVLLSDFGLVLMAQSTRFQNLQNVAGTLAYIAPEQIQGKPRPASDQYSLGAVVYEWLSGEVLFQGSLTEIVSQQLAVSPPPLSSKIPEVSPAVEQVVMTALEKDPKKRFGSVREFALALEQASQAVIEQTSVPVVPQVGETLHEHTLPPLREESIAVGDEPTFLPKPLSARIAQAEPAGTIVCSYRGHLAAVSSLSWSPDGRQIVSVSGEKIVHVWDAKGGQPVSVYRGHAGAVYAVAWSSDGKVIVSGGSDTTVHVWESFTGRSASLYRGQSARVLSVAWNPARQEGMPVSSLELDTSSSGRRVACGREDGMVQMWDTVTGREVVAYRHFAPVYVVAWSPDGKRFAFASDDKMVQVWDTTSNLQLFTFRHAAAVHVLAWSPDGKYIASSDGATIQIWCAS